MVKSSHQKWCGVKNRVNLVRKIDLSSFQVASSATARDINRRIILNLLRMYQPISRAGLARHSGLQRSTVSAITEQLIQERWVTEGARGQLPRGRKPTLLYLNTQRAGILGVDIRPKTTTFALAGIDARFQAQGSIATGSNPSEFVNGLANQLRDLMKANPNLLYEGVGIALPGRVDPATQRLVFAPNLGWADIELQQTIEQATGLPVKLENAANACALAELWLGRSTEGLRNFIVVTVSEGIGTGIIMNGQLVRGSSDMAGEFGHVQLRDDGPTCRCGNRGCWEVWGSNSAACRYYAEATSTAGKRSSSKNSAPSPEFEDLLRLAKQNDLRACQSLEKMAHYLGEGISMLVNGLAPEAVVLVGEITRAWSRVGPIIEGIVKRHSLPHAATRIIPTDPAEQPRLRGAVVLVLQEHFGAPTVA